MGQKTHPTGFRLGIIKTWSSRWYEEKNYAKWLHEDLKLKAFIKKKLNHAGVSFIEIERAANKAKILGLNAARIYGVDPERKRCEVNACPTAELKLYLDQELGPRRWVFRPPAGPRSYREYLELSKRRAVLGTPG